MYTYLGLAQHFRDRSAACLSYSYILGSNTTALILSEIISFILFHLHMHSDIIVLPACIF